jgi:hypothetical protein
LAGIQKYLPDHRGFVVGARKFGAGDWFAVPLRNGGFGVGLIARGKKSLLVGYFFGPKQVTVPTLSDVVALSAADAILLARFGDLGLRQGVWPLLGRNESWDVKQWPMPVFVRYEVLTGRSFNVFYDETDPNFPPGVAEQAPSSDLFGYGALEKRLTRLLAG